MANRLYVDTMPKSVRLRRLAWGLVYALFFRPTPRFMLDRWRLFLLRSFGAEIGEGCRVAPTCFVWAPWNLKMGVFSSLAEGVDCYTQAVISIGDYCTVSQRTFLCTASHDISKLERPLISSPIEISSHAWICAEAFIGPGVRVGEGAVLAARGVAVSDIPPWSVWGGNPALQIKTRPKVQLQAVE